MIESPIRTLLNLIAYNHRDRVLRVLTSALPGQAEVKLL